MPRCRLTVLSDIHYASAAEKSRFDFCLRRIPNPMHRFLIKYWNHFVWEREPFAYNHLLDQFLDAAPSPDWVIANGDYTSDTAFVGVSDDAACQSAAECLQKLRGKFGERFAATIGDHELGKVSMGGGGRGGLRLASYHRSLDELRLQSFWQLTLGKYVLIGVASPLLALPVYWPETLEGERPEWERLRAAHLAEIQAAFAALKSHHRVLLFCHDPTALPFLWRNDRVRSKLGQLEQTIIGHLHSEWLFKPTRWLAGMPTVNFLGPTARRVTIALGQAKYWRPFRVRLCPALRGIDLMKDGGYYTVDLDLEGNTPAKFHRHRLRPPKSKIQNPKS